MKRILKWIFIILGGVIMLIVILGLTVFLRGQSKVNDHYDVTSHALDLAPSDSAMLVRGEHLATISNCNGCHGAQFEGSVLVDDDAFGIISAPNLTSGLGGIGDEYDVVDWERAIRHGVAKDGRPLIAMPSNYYSRFSDADLAALISYLTTIPSVDNSTPQRTLGPIAKLLVGSGQYVPSALSIDHDAVHIEAPAIGPTEAYGEYLVQLTHCGDCHGSDLAGQDVEGPPPGPDITHTGNSGQWTEAEFMRAIRTGMTPDGRVLDPEQMPWQRMATMSETELRAIWTFLETL